MLDRFRVQHLAWPRAQSIASAFSSLFILPGRFASARHAEREDFHGPTRFIAFAGCLIGMAWSVIAQSLDAILLSLSDLASDYSDCSVLDGNVKPISANSEATLNACIVIIDRYSPASYVASGAPTMRSKKK
jgi:hypothetical protein